MTGADERVELVQVFLARAATVRERWPGAEAWLTDIEHRRARGFRFTVDREAFIAAHILVRIATAWATGWFPWDVGLVQRCPSCARLDHGRPAVAVPGWEVSFSHSGRLVAAVAAPCPVAVDIEDLSRAPDDVGCIIGVHDRSRNSDDLAGFLVTWTLKECLVKLGLATLDSVLPVHLDHDGDTARFGSARLAAYRHPDAIVSMGLIASVPRPTFTWIGAEPLPPQ